MSFDNPRVIPQNAKLERLVQDQTEVLSSILETLEEIRTVLIESRNAVTDQNYDTHSKLDEAVTLLGHVRDAVQAEN